MKIIKIITYDDVAEETLNKLKKLEEEGELIYSDCYISDAVY